MTELLLADLLPHKPPMILLDGLVDHNDDWVHTLVSLSQDSPFFKDGSVPSYVAIEYMAQAIALWSGLKSRQQGNEPTIGFLLGTRKLSLGVAVFPENAELHIYGQSKFSDGELASFDCWIDCNGKRVASATLNVFQPENNPFDNGI